MKHVQLQYRTIIVFLVCVYDCSFWSDTVSLELYM